MTQHSPRHLRIFLASPGDVVEERRLAIAILEQLAYEPSLRGRVTVEVVAWDKSGGGAPVLATMTPQEAISLGLPKPSECDIVVVIFWARIGTLLPPQYTKEDGSRYLSGTEWEYENAIKSYEDQGRPEVLLYRRTEPISLSMDDPQFDEKYEQGKLVREFFNSLTNPDGSIKRGHNVYRNPNEFRELFEHQVKAVIVRLLDSGAPGWSPAPSLPAPVRPPHNLPPRIFGELLGRKADLDRVMRALESRYPLITIEGFAGVGKTSLAIEAGYACLPMSEKKRAETITFHYVVWVSALYKPGQERWMDEVLNAIARVMDFFAITQLPPQQIEEKKVRVDELLRGRRVLVIVDNFETIKDPDLVAWIEKVPEPSKVLVTSRWRQFSMSLPVDLEGLADNDALNLIRQHARTLGLDFITEKDDEELLPLVRNTGGNPQVIVMALGAIKGGAASLEEVIKGLHTNYKDKNINKVFQYLFSNSWKGITEGAQKVLLVVPLFVGAGSIRKDALRAASGLSEKYEFDQALSQLVEFKLLQVNYKESRYIAHPMTRAFARSKLNQRRKFETGARDRWSKYFLEFVRSNIVREKPAQRYWNALVSDKMEAIDAEWPSIHEVMKWADQNEQDELLLELVMLLVHYMDSRFTNLERLTYVRKAVEAAGRMGLSEDEALLRLDALGWTCVEEYRLDEAYEEIIHGFNIAEELSDRSDSATDMVALGFAWRARVRIEQGRSGEASELIKEALAIKCSPWIKSRVYMAAGDIAMKQDESRKALGFYEEAARNIDEYGGEGHGYQIDPRIGLAYLSTGNLDEAEEKFLALRANDNIPIGKLYGDYGLALVAYQRNQKEEARRLAHETREALSRRTTSNLLLKMINKLFEDIEAANA